MVDISIKNYHRIRLSELRKGNLLILDKLKNHKTILYENLSTSYQDTTRYIAGCVSFYTGVDVGEFYPDKPNGKKDAREAKHLFRHFIRRVFQSDKVKEPLNLTDIIKMIGVKNHSHIVYSDKCVMNNYRIYKDYRKMYDDLKTRIYESR